MAVGGRRPGGLLLPRDRRHAAERQRPGREPGPHELHRRLLRVRAQPRLRHPKGAPAVTSPLALLGGARAVTKPAPHFTWPPIYPHTISKVVSQLTSTVS